MRHAAGGDRVQDALRPSLIAVSTQVLSRLRAGYAKLSYRILIEVRDYLAAQARLPLWKAYLLRRRMRRELKRCETEVLLATMAFIVR